ncbi:MAG: GNAT family N-acetyltransferase [Brevundimonas sp.]|uniref:GNAT family N-acetyltransferase n=1 Tax=Brevundimonas sp. TaxID=1871086 RepID=UPI0025C3C8BE|nr:GNAT family protein [Brevundimonas sp.]MCH4269588.1 GNAT family N-acetyltransferase [Brevundimonas sp.]
MKLSPIVLEDAFVRLEPFSEALKEEVRAALDCDADAWKGMVAAAYGAHFDDWWDAALRAMTAGSRIAYAVRRRSDGAVVGTTSLYEIRPEHRRCEVGSTFYRPEARGGSINPACKRLLLDYAFSNGAIRVEIITDALNAASQAAIRKLGATFEGVLRKHKTTWTGRARDTAQFAILDEDWFEVRRRLDERLGSLA